MGRKENDVYDFDDDYGAYDDYDYDDGDDYYSGYDNVSKNKVGKVSEKQQKNTKRNVWRCAICTFDNEEGTSECSICGVLRNSPIKSSNNDQTSRVPFKFDTPSPDDLVSMGKQSSKIWSKANLGKSSLDVPSSINENSANHGSTENFSKASSDAPSSIKKNNTIHGSTSNIRDSSLDTSSSIKENNANQKAISKNYVEKEKGGVISEETPNISSDFASMSLNVKSGKSKNVNEGSSTSVSQYKAEKWMLPDKTEDKKCQLNLAIVGHVDSGKSTISGRLLHLLGRISKKEMHKYEKDARIQGKSSFAYAWALDESSEERERGVTMTVGVAYFTSIRYHVVILDSPGHEDLIPNLISGATQADAAILVIDASRGAFEASIHTTYGRTKEHAQLIRSFGADQVVVAVNKMDAVEYSKERFDSIKLQLGTILRSCGFKDTSVTWVALSAMENQNLVASASDARLSWFEGPCLLDAIDNLQPPHRDYGKPLLMPICDVIKLSPQGQLSLCGKLEAGAMRSGSKVLVMPSKEIGTVRSLDCDGQACGVARAGDCVAVSLQGISENSVGSGVVLCHPDFPVAVANHLELKVLVLDVKTPIVNGSQLEFHIHHAKEAATVVKILSLLDIKTGKVTKKTPRCLLAKQSAIIEVILQNEVCLDEYSSTKALGRVSLRSSGATVAVGVVNKIIKEGQKLF